MVEPNMSDFALGIQFASVFVVMFGLLVYALLQARKR